MGKNEVRVLKRLLSTEERAFPSFPKWFLLLWRFQSGGYSPPLPALPPSSVSAAAASPEEGAMGWGGGSRRGEYHSASPPWALFPLQAWQIGVFRASLPSVHSTFCALRKVPEGHQVYHPSWHLARILSTLLKEDMRSLRAFNTRRRNQIIYEPNGFSWPGGILILKWIS